MHSGYWNYSVGAAVADCKGGLPPPHIKPSALRRPATRRVRVHRGRVRGLDLCIIDTPGLVASADAAACNTRTLRSIKGAYKRHSPQFVLYVDRLDAARPGFGELGLLGQITQVCWVHVGLRVVRVGWFWGCWAPGAGGLGSYLRAGLPSNSLMVHAPALPHRHLARRCGGRRLWCSRTPMRHAPRWALSMGACRGSGATLCRCGWCRAGSGARVACGCGGEGGSRRAEVGSLA